MARSTKRSSAVRLQVESLEDRATPAILFNPVFGTETEKPNDGGHAVLLHPEVHQNFWGTTGTTT
jgi:hypothetical protein